MDWTIDSVEYLHERATSTQQTGFSFIAQARNFLPNPIGGIFWLGVDDTYSNVYVPMYCGITKVPEAYREGNGDMLNFTFDAAFWVFNWVANFAYTRYCDIIVDIQKVQSELETKFFTETAELDIKASGIYKTDPVKAINMITEYSAEQGNNTVKRWKELGKYLFVKYMDGNVKKEKDGKFLTNGYSPHIAAYPNQPRYPDDWYRRIVKDHGDVIKMKKLPSEKK
jgi:dipeptidase